MATSATELYVRADIANQGLTSSEQANARVNIDTRSTAEITFPTVATIKAASVPQGINVVQTRAYATTSTKRGGAKYVRTPATFLTGYTFTASIVAGSASATITSLSGLRVTVGGPISGPGVPSGTIVLSNDGTNLVMSQAATSTNPAVSLASPTHAGYFLSADGAVWSLNEDEPNLWMFGALGDFSDDTTAIQNALNWLASGAGSTLVIPPTSSAFRFLSDVRVLGAGGYLIRGTGAKSRLECRNGSRFIIGHAIPNGVDSLGRVIKSGVLVSNVTMEKLAVIESGASGPLVLVDYCNTILFRDVSVANTVQNGPGVSHAWKTNWVQWATWDTCASSVNGASIWIELPAASGFENEDHFTINNCNFYCAKVRSVDFDPAIVVANHSVGAALPQTASTISGSRNITFAAAPVKLDGTLLGNGSYAVDGPGIPSGAYVTVNGTSGTLFLNNSALTADPAATPNATVTASGVTINLHTKRSVPFYNFNVKSGHWGSFMSYTTVVGSTMSGSPTLTVDAPNGLFASMPISGPGIQADTYIVSGSGTSFVLSKNATATASGVTLIAGDDGVVSGGLRIITQIPGMTVFQNASIKGVFFEYIDYPMDFQRYGTNDFSHFVMEDCSTLRSDGTVFHGGPNNTFSSKDCNFLQGGTLVDGPVGFFAGQNRIASFSSVTKQAFGRLHLSAKGPGLSSLRGVTLRNNGTSPVSAGSTSLAVNNVALSAMPDIVQASPSWNHGGWWFSNVTISNTNANGGGLVSFAINWMNAAPAGASIGWKVEVADV